MCASAVPTLSLRLRIPPVSVAVSIPPRRGANVRWRVPTRRSQASADCSVDTAACRA